MLGMTFRWKQSLCIFSRKNVLQRLLSFVLSLLRWNKSHYHKNFCSAQLHICIVQQHWNTSLLPLKKDSYRQANSIWFSSTLWAGPAAHQHTWIHFVWSLLCTYRAKRSSQFPGSCHLPVSDTDENCSMFRSPQHYHSVFSICSDQMTPMCWFSMINVVLGKTTFFV